MSSGDLSRTHPEMVRRIEALEGLVVAAGGRFGYTSTWRPKEADDEPPTSQRTFYVRHRTGKGNLASDPDRVIGKTVWGWDAVGSWHIIQADGWSHAIDFDIRKSGLAPKRYEQLAMLVGLRRTEPSENWHFQWVSVRDGIFEPTAPWLLGAPVSTLPPPPPPPPEVLAPVIPLFGEEDDDDMIDKTHVAEERPGTTGIFDITFMPANGEERGRYVIESKLVIRQRPAKGEDGFVTVWFDGNATKVALPGDGRTVEVVVTRRGLVSVSDAIGCFVEGREVWYPNAA